MNIFGIDIGKRSSEKSSETMHEGKRNAEERAHQAKDKVDENVRHESEEAQKKAHTIAEKMHNLSESLKRRLSEGPAEPFEAHGEDIEADIMATSKALSSHLQESEKAEK
uniref:Uncharacterized protein n=1 Tax=Trichuris muris TaxID=70415 RepID=A0A5S6QRA3_TRIMR